MKKSRAVILILLKGRGTRGRFEKGGFLDPSDVKEVKQEPNSRKEGEGFTIRGKVRLSHQVAGCDGGSKEKKRGTSGNKEKGWCVSRRSPAWVE